MLYTNMSLKICILGCEYEKNDKIEFTKTQSSQRLRTESITQGRGERRGRQHRTEDAPAEADGDRGGPGEARRP